jgi:hypothetical protein
MPDIDADQVPIPVPLAALTGLAATVRGLGVGQSFTEDRAKRSSVAAAIWRECKVYSEGKKMFMVRNIEGGRIRVWRTK